MLPLRTTAPSRRELAPRWLLWRPACTRPGTGLQSRLILDSGVLAVGSVEVTSCAFRFADPAEACHHVVLFPRGPLWVHEARGQRWLADATTLVCHRGDRSYSSALETAVRLDWFGLAPELLSDLAGAAASVASLTLADGPCEARSFLSQRLAFLAIARADAASALAVEEATVRVIGEALQLTAIAAETHHVASAANELVTNARLFVAANFAGNPSLEEVARAAGVSPFHLCRTFKRVVGLTLNRYVAEVRLRAALDLVTQGELDLATIAVELGFSSHSHFTVRFRDIFGDTPSAVRRLVARLDRNGTQRGAVPATSPPSWADSWPRSAC